MHSPISKRKEVAPDLDEDENEFFEAFQEYRQTEIYNDFRNYKDYYIDAQITNNEQIKKQQQIQKQKTEILTSSNKNSKSKEKGASKQLQFEEMNEERKRMGDQVKDGKKGVKEV